MNVLRPEWTKGRFPPQGFPYTDKRTGHVFDATAGDLTYRVADVQKHRRANPHVYPDAQDLNADFIRQEIIDFMCNKNPSLCSDVDLSLVAPPAPESPKPSHPCVRCQSWDLKPNYCLSCGGNRISDWTCNSCGAKVSA